MLGKSFFVLDLFKISSMFLPMITKPTRITKSTATLIDSIFSNDNKNSYFNGILYSDLSDHLPVFSIVKNEEISQ